jgi:3-oxoacyl-[acyl-carrier protein] reductase
MSGHPQAAQLGFNDIEPGAEFSVGRTFERDDVLAFAALCGDYSPLHVDPEYAATTEFGACVVHGMLLASLFSQLVGMQVPGKHALYLGQDLTFRRPVRVGEMVRASAKVTAKNAATRTLVLQTEIRGSDDRVVVSGSARVKLRDDTRVNVVPGDAPAPSGTDATPQRRAVALVTGGSRGLGAATARLLAQRGFAVAVVYWRSADAAAAVVDDIRIAGGTALAVQADIRDSAAVAALVAKVSGEIGPPTLLVNAATGELDARPATELAWSEFEGHFAYQVKGVLQLCQAVHAAMKAAGGGAIVNLGSQVTGNVPATRMADYVSAKYALLGLSKALAAEWSEDGIRVNMVSPGLVRTELTQNYHERVFKLEAARTPLRRLATADDVARAVAYLASDDAGFVTGVNLFVTGGQIML